MARILIVDDDKSIRKTLRDILEFEKYTVHEAADGLEAIVKLKQASFDVIILDVKMPRMDGMEAIEKIQNLCPDTPVVMISGHGNIDTAVEAVKKGAFDFIQKLPDLNRLLATLRNALDNSTLITEKKVLQKKVSNSRVQEIIGKSEGIALVKSTIEKVAPTDARVLVTGQNGTGKELVARWIHQLSKRKEYPIVEVNCAAIPSELIESELFGHEKGSFTSAIKQRLGKFEQAHGGTLFLDEIGDMSPSAQAKVLRALHENKITRVGGEKDITVDVRVIADTNKSAASHGRREDLPRPRQCRRRPRAGLCRGARRAGQNRRHRPRALRTVGGSSIKLWQKGAKLYEDALRRAKLALQTTAPVKARLRGILWLQGEANANAEELPLHAERLRAMIEAFRTDLAQPDLPFIACTVGEMKEEPTLSNLKAMNEIQLALPKTVPHTACVDARDLKTHIGDSVHFDTAAPNEIGKRFAAKLAEMQKK